jgi:hypothetical protein
MKAVLGAALRVLGKLSVAGKYLKHVTLKSSYHGYMMVAKGYQLQGQLEEALKMAKELIKTKPAPEEAHAFQAVLAVAVSETRSAVQTGEKHLTEILGQGELYAGMADTFREKLERDYPLIDALERGEYLSDEQLEELRAEMLQLKTKRRPQKKTRP